MRHDLIEKLTERKMRFITSFLYCLTVITISQLPPVLANGPHGDEDDRFRSSGSGYVTIEPPTNTVRYKKVEMKFQTRHAFQNLPTNGVFMAEVAEELAYALNSHGGPMPMLNFRPAVVNVDEIHREPTPGADQSPSQRPNEARYNQLKFKCFMAVPYTVNVKDYFDRISINPFFHTLRLIREDDRHSVELSEEELKEYVIRRLPPRESGDPTHVNVEREDTTDNNEEPTNNQPGNINIEVHYKSFQTGEFFRDPATLAAMIAAALAGLLCTILCTVFVVYRMRKKDEGSYALDEPKNTYKYNKEIYIASATKEFFA